MRLILAAVAAMLVSSTLSAQPTRRVSEWLVFNNDEECVAVSAPLIDRAAAGRDRLSFSLGVFAEFADSMAARPLPAVVISAFAGQRLGGDSELFGEGPGLTLRLDGGAPRTYFSRFGHFMHDDDREGQTAYFKIPRADLERIARARRVTGRVSSFSFTFGPQQMAALRELSLYAARSLRASVPQPGGPLQVDCDSYRSIVR